MPHSLYHAGDGGYHLSLPNSAFPYLQQSSSSHGAGLQQQDFTAPSEEKCQGMHHLTSIESAVPCGHGAEDCFPGERLHTAAAIAYPRTIQVQCERWQIAAETN